jgi:hypothetical protein
MKQSLRILIGLTSIALFGVVIYFAKKDQTLKRRSQEVADEGYETAYDVLYPMVKRRVRFF